jgi:hypothetical protein
MHELPTIDSLNKFCEGCVIDKHSKSSFPKVVKYQAKKFLKLVHTNIYGLIKPNSIGENQYFITFIDDFSQKT